MKADERAGKKITGKAKLKNTAENYADNQNAEIFTRALTCLRCGCICLVGRTGGTYLVLEQQNMPH